MIGRSVTNYQDSDLKEMILLFNRTVQAINKKDYTEKQIEQLLNPSPNYETLRKVFDSTHTLVAKNHTKLLGFGNISDSGTLDYLYVDKDWIGYGIGTSLATQLIRHAFHVGAKEITVHATITAKPFFEKLGFRLIKQQNDYRNGVLLLNYLMVLDN